MANDGVTAEAVDDDFDLTAALTAEFDKAEGGDPSSPAETPAEPTAAERARDEKGRFAPKAEEAVEADPKVAVAASSAPAAKVAPEAVAAAQEPVAAVQADPATAATRPPPGWSPSAKVAFNELPSDHPIRQAVAQREAEIDKGFAKLADFKPIERYAEMARQSGTTLDKALENYVSIETALRQDFQAGIARICQNQGVNPVEMAKAILTRAGVSQPQSGEPGATQGYQTPQVDLTPIHQEINTLKSYFQQQQTSAVQSEIQRFASDPKHVFFDNVRTEMGRLMDSGLAENLADAYDRACWANPEIRPLLIKQQSAPATDASAKAAAAAQARNASKSITGSPVHGASHKGPEQSIEDEIRELMNASV